MKTALKFRSVLGAIGVTFALTFGLAVGVAPSASAADHSMQTTDGHVFGENPGGSMWFNTYGDVVTVCDRDADGEYAVLTVYEGGYYGPIRYTITAKGEGNCTTRKASMGSKFNLREGRTYGFELCTATASVGGIACNGNAWKNTN
jgi:hypothetical protein